MNRNPLYALALAVLLAYFGYRLLNRGDILIGGFAWWACGVNCALACKNKRAKKPEPQPEFLRGA